MQKLLTYAPVQINPQWWLHAVHMSMLPVCFLWTVETNLKW